MFLFGHLFYQLSNFQDVVIIFWSRVSFLFDLSNIFFRSALLFYSLKFQIYFITVVKLFILSLYWYSWVSGSTLMPNNSNLREFWCLYFYSSWYIYWHVIGYAGYIFIVLKCNWYWFFWNWFSDTYMIMNRIIFLLAVSFLSSLLLELFLFLSLLFLLPTSPHFLFILLHFFYLARDASVRHYQWTHSTY